MNGAKWRSYEKNYNNRTNNRGRLNKLLFLFSSSVFIPVVKSMSEEEIDKYYKECIFMKQLVESGKAKELKHWELIYETKELCIWRRPLAKRPSIYEYRGFGTFKDVNPFVFYLQQLDLARRSLWDPQILNWSIKSPTDHLGENDLVYWLCNYPFPFSSREYIYSRQKKICKKFLLLTSHAVDVNTENIFNIKPRGVRVNCFRSDMIMIPHSSKYIISFKDKVSRQMSDMANMGKRIENIELKEIVQFDYLISYYDDPELNTSAYSTLHYLAKSGMKDFLTALHQAAIRDMKSKKKHDCYNKK
ncbi:hypothetical protein SNEBB_008790 [Seison nebaliae]|nr:hypothetical protein SNEBB_008790 [Seison nebaliae]